MKYVPARQHCRTSLYRLRKARPAFVILSSSNCRNFQRARRTNVSIFPRFMYFSSNCKALRYCRALISCAQERDTSRPHQERRMSVCHDTRSVRSLLSSSWKQASARTHRHRHRHTDTQTHTTHTHTGLQATCLRSWRCVGGGMHATLHSHRLHVNAPA